VIVNPVIAPTASIPNLPGVAVRDPLGDLLADRQCPATGHPQRGDLRVLGADPADPRRLRHGDTGAVLAATLAFGGLPGPSGINP
jgi:hypothetical protein